MPSGVSAELVTRLDGGAPANGAFRLGGWLFRHRSWLPGPAALALVLVRRGEVETAWLHVAGPGFVLLGQILRLWAVRQIGSISRTRATRYGPLVMDGPYALLRNPLYGANWLLWTGFVMWSELLWMLPLVWALFALQYGAIAKWEEGCLRIEFGSRYHAYACDVPRWRPRLTALSSALSTPPRHAWRDVAFSERGTLLSVGLMTLLLMIKGVW